MKLRQRKKTAFTLIEVLVASTLLSLVVAAIISAHLFGLNMSLTSAIKLDAADDGRITLFRLMQDIRGAFTMQIGEGTINSFTLASSNSLQCGNAIQLFASTNRVDYIRYYYESNRLCRTEDGQTSTFVTANSITNKITVYEGGKTNVIPIFSEIELDGDTLTNTAPFASVRVYLKFVKLNTSRIIIGPSNLVDFYNLDTIITPRKY